MSKEFVESSFREGTERAVVDYIASMTDRFAMRIFKQLFVPDAFHVL
jgi:dGTPase